MFHQLNLAEKDIGKCFVLTVSEFRRLTGRNWRTTQHDASDTHAYIRGCTQVTAHALVFALLLGNATLACSGPSESGELAESVAVHKQVLRGSTDLPPSGDRVQGSLDTYNTCNEGADEAEVSVQWTGMDPSRAIEETAKTVRATIRNNTDRALSASPVLLLQHRATGSRKQTLPAIKLGPRESQAVSVNVDSLAVQSVGVPTSLTLGVLWDAAGRDRVMTVPNALSSDLHVTHAAGYKSAVIRSAQAQWQAEKAEIAQGRRPQVVAYRELNAKGQWLNRANESLAALSGSHAVTISPEQLDRMRVNQPDEAAVEQGGEL